MAGALPAGRKVIVWLVLSACVISSVVYAGLWIRTVFNMRDRQQEGLVAMRVCDAWRRNHEGVYPPMQPGKLMFPEDVFASARIPEANVPAWQQSFEQHWWYIGYAISSDEEAARFFDVFPAIAEAAELEVDLQTADGAIPRLKLPVNSAADVLPYDPAKTPMLIQKPGHYAPVNAGAWVGYADGSWEFIKKFPGTFPWTEATVQRLQAFARTRR